VCGERGPHVAVEADADVAPGKAVLRSRSLPWSPLPLLLLLLLLPQS